MNKSSINFSGPAIGVVAGTKIPNYCVMSETANIAREIERHGEGMRILISEASRRLIDKVGGFRCESRGVLDIKVGFLPECKGRLHPLCCSPREPWRHSGWLDLTTQTELELGI